MEFVEKFQVARDVVIHVSEVDGVEMYSWVSTTGTSSFELFETIADAKSDAEIHA